jgi:hypothetical protein
VYGVYQRYCSDVTEKQRKAEEAGMILEFFHPCYLTFKPVSGKLYKRRSMNVVI